MPTVVIAITTPRIEPALDEVLDARGVVEAPSPGAVSRLRASIAAIPELAEAIRRNDLERAAACFERVAGIEAEACTELSKIVGVAGLPIGACLGTARAIHRPGQSIQA